MSRLLFNKGIVPSAPAVAKQAIFSDSSDNKLKMRDGDSGLTMTLVEDGVRSWNTIINGEFDFAQRQPPGSATTYSNASGRAYGADRWGVTNEVPNVTYQRIDTSAAVEAGIQSRFYGRYAKTGSTGKIVVSQVIEGTNCLHLRGRQVRVQLKVKASTSKTMRVALLQLSSSGTLDTIPGTFISAFGANGTDPTFGTNLLKISPDAGTADNATITANGLSCAATSNWQRFGAAFTLPSDFKNLIVVVFTNDLFVAADHFNMAEAGLYDGPEIREWVPRQTRQQLANCQRYYSKTFNVDTAPAQNAGALTGEARIPSPVGASTAFGVNWTWEFPVPMFKVPTLTLYNPQAANAQVRNQTLNTDCTASAVAANGDKRCVINATTPASTVAGTNILGIHISADAEL
jgi:hypothetical protein